MESRARYIRPLAQIGGEVGGPDLDGTGGLSGEPLHGIRDRKSTRLNSSHSQISYAVFCLKKKNRQLTQPSLLISSVVKLYMSPTSPFCTLCMHLLNRRYSHQCLHSYLTITT